MSMMLTGTSPTAELYSRALSNAYRWYYRLIDPDWSLEQDPEIWIKKAWRDPVLAQAMQTRMHMVAGREWEIQPGRKNPSPEDTRAAEVVADAFARIAKFSEARALLATSVLRGSAYAFTEGTRETVTLGGLRGNWWTPRKLRNISKQRFIYTPETITHEDGRQTIEVQQRFYPLMDPWPVVVPPEFAERIIKVVYLDEEDRLTGIGGRPLLESVYFLFWAKSEVMKTGLQTLEKWAGGLLIGKTDLNANPGELGRDSDSVRDEMLTMLESMRGRHVAVVDKEDEIEHIDGGAGGGGAAFLEFLRYMDEKIVGLLLGSVLPFGQSGDSAGSYARAVEERAVSDLILDFDKQNISEAISDTVIRLFWKNNRPQLAAAGLADAAMPQFSILPERRDDFAANAQILSQAINSGMKVKTSEAFEKLGLTQPTQEEIDAGEVIEKEEPAGGGFPFRESPGAKFADDNPLRFPRSPREPEGGEKEEEKKKKGPADRALPQGETTEAMIKRIREIKGDGGVSVSGGPGVDRDGIAGLAEKAAGAVMHLEDIGGFDNAAIGHLAFTLNRMENPPEISYTRDDSEGSEITSSRLDRLVETLGGFIPEVRDKAAADGDPYIGSRRTSDRQAQIEMIRGRAEELKSRGEEAAGMSVAEIKDTYGPKATKAGAIRQLKARLDSANESIAESEAEMGRSSQDTPAAEAPSTSRKRCPDGSRKDEDSGACEKFAEGREGDPHDPDPSPISDDDFSRIAAELQKEKGDAQIRINRSQAMYGNPPEQPFESIEEQNEAVERRNQADFDAQAFGHVYGSGSFTQPMRKWAAGQGIDLTEYKRMSPAEPGTRERKEQEKEDTRTAKEMAHQKKRGTFGKKKKTAEAPSGKRKRCPDGEHKDEDGQCRPVT